MNVYERESREYLRAVIYKGEELMLDGVYFAVLPLNERPSVDDWQAALVLDGKTGIIVDDYPVGLYTVWVRVVSDPEDVVKKLENIRVI